jgi:hypothetical protein
MSDDVPLKRVVMDAVFGVATDSEDDWALPPYDQIAKMRPKELRKRTCSDRSRGPPAHIRIRGFSGYLPSGNVIYCGG